MTRLFLIVAVFSGLTLKVEAQQATLSLAIDPTWSTNATATPVRNEDYLTRYRALLNVKGVVKEGLGYRFLAGMANERFLDFPAGNNDAALYGGAVTIALGDFDLSATGRHVTVFDNFFETQIVSLGEFGLGLTTQVPLSKSKDAWIVTPGLAVKRRTASLESFERVEFSPSIGLDGKLWDGAFNAGAAVYFRNFDLLGRRDTNFQFSVSWAKQVAKHVTMGVRASYENNNSNIIGRSYDVFEVGPTLLFSFSTQ